jgi:ubiquinone/menaquinone biosynthesis C-methylase UbiE
VTEQQIRFDDGDAYERAMGVWSALAGNVFLDWLAPPSSLPWLDVGCGSGAFTELVVQRFAPADAQGVDPSEGQLSFARTRPAAKVAEFSQGEAMALPFANNGFDIAVMALVLFFVPDPAKGVAEMKRVVRSDGTVAAYLWDFEAGGFPFEPVYAELRAMGIAPPLPPTVQASRMDVLRELWAGLDEVEARTITVSRTFASFEEFWDITIAGSAARRIVEGMAPVDAEHLKSQVRAKLVADTGGRITYEATANAIKGRVPD